MALTHLRSDDGDDGLGANGIEVALEMASPKVPDDDLPPGPDVDAQQATPPVPEQKAEVKETDLPKDRPTETEDPDLEEVRYGRWEGMVFDDLIDDPEYVRYREHPLTWPTPGGETIAQVQERGMRAVRRAIEANPEKRILFVSHGDIIRTVLCHLLGCMLDWW